MGYKKTAFLFLAAVFLYAGGFISFAQSPQEQSAREHYRLGEIYYQHGLKEEAAREFQKALELMEEPQSASSEPLVEEKAPQASPKEPQETRAARGNEYVISAGDVLYISVWENPDLTQEVVVRPDGKISFPLIDEAYAEGKTISELDEDITERLKEFVRYPDISISLRSMGGEKVIILGEVTHPGVYALEGRRTVLEAVALAGGFTEDAVLSSVIIIKGGFENPRAERINLTRAIERAEISQDINLVAQDVVFVPKKFVANLNYFMSKIIEPLTRGALTYYTIGNAD